MPTVIPVIYVVHQTGEEWVIHGDRRGEEFGRFGDKAAAIAAGRRIAKKKRGQLIVRQHDLVEFAEDYASVER